MLCPPRKGVPVSDGRLRPDPEPARPSNGSMLPGDNPYDQAVFADVITYQDAKIREEVLRVREVTERERITTEQARISLERDRIDLAEKRGQFITKEENHARLEALCTAFSELLRLTVSEATKGIPPSEKPAVQERMTEKTTHAMRILAECVAKRNTHDQITTALHRAFTS